MYHNSGIAGSRTNRSAMPYHPSRPVTYALSSRLLLKHFRPHVAAMEIPVTILTDHANLTHWKATRKVNRRVARWFAKIQDYNLTIKHIPGKIHTAPDMLSRPPRMDQGKSDNTDIVLLPPSLFIATTSVQDNMLKAKVKEMQ